MSKLIVSLFVGFVLFTSCTQSQNSTKQTNQNPEKKMETQQTLKSQLDARRESFNQRADEKKKQVYEEGIDAVESTGIIENALNVGDKAPNFSLTNASGNQVELYDYLKKGKVVLTWYRGGWCPYCNLTLHQLGLELPNFKENNANLLALTPELPDKSLSTVEKNNLQFEVLSDIGSKVAKEYGIVFKLTDEVAKYYNLSFDLEEFNGDTSNELPLAATYIIDSDGTILYAFLDADYRNRAEPSLLTEILQKK